MKDLKIIGENLGYISVLVGVVSLAAFIVPIYFGEVSSFEPFFISSGIFFSLGAFLIASCKTEKETKLRHAMITAALAWLMIPIVSTVPFMQITGLDFLSALFESMSGWTGTGLTMIAKESTLTHTIQFWRSFIEWVGGIGVIVLTLAILARPGTASFTLYKSEARKRKIKPTIISTVRTIWWIFLLYTVGGVLLYIVAGMPAWGAINHSMTGIATGGFSVVDQSIGTYNSPLIELVSLPIMLFGAIAFIVHYRLLKGNFRKFFSDAQNKTLFWALILGGGSLTLFNLITYPQFLASLRHSIFQFVSAVTCTGFQTADIHAWQATSKLIASAAMVLGGAAGSTAGGIKLIRGSLVFKRIKWGIKEVFLPERSKFPRKIGSRKLTEDEAEREVNEASTLLILWVILLFIGIIVLLNTTGGALDDTIFEVASAQGNVGLSTGITSLGMNPIAKVMLIINMWAGRLEIIPLLVLLRSFIFRGKIF